MKIVIKSLTISLTLAMTQNLFAQENPFATVGKLAVEVTDATEKLPETKITPDELQLDSAKTEYWYRNAQLRSSVDEISSETVSNPCENTCTGSKESSEKAGGHSQVSLMVRYVTAPDFAHSNDFMQELMRSSTPSDMINGIIWAKTAQDREDVLARAGQELTFEEKIKLGSYLGGTFGGNYDYSRAQDGSPSSSGIVTLAELIEGLKQGKRKGVCRDIAQAQVEVLNKMGVDCKTISYATQSGYGHATVACTDPNNPDRTIKLNYGEVTSDTESGTLALRQNTSIPDLTLSYDIYDKNGKILLTQSSELGKMMAEVTGLKARQLDPNERYRSSLVKAEIADTGSIFYGKTPDGIEVAGLALHGDHELHFKTGSGKDYGTIKTTAGASIAGAKKVSAALESDHLIIYGRVNTEYSTPDLVPSANIDSKLFTGFNGEMSVTKVLSIEDGSEAPDDLFRKYKTSVDVGNRSQITLRDGSKVGIEAAERLTIGSSDVRDNNASFTASPTHTMIRSTYEKPFEQDLSLIVGTTATYRNQLGSTISGDVSLRGKKFESSIGYEQRIDPKTPGYVPGATPTVVASHEQRFGEKKDWILILQAEAQTNQLDDGIYTIFVEKKFQLLTRGLKQNALNDFSGIIFKAPLLGRH